MKTFQFIIYLLLTNAVFAQPYMVQDVHPSSVSAGVLNANGIEYNNWYYYAADDSVYGQELWKSNGDTCMMVADLFQGNNTTTGWPNNSSPMEFLVFDGRLFFSAINSIEGYELWEYDGVNSPQLANWLPFVALNATFDPVSYSMRVFNGDLFIFRTGYNFAEIYKYDGLTASQISTPLTGGSIVNEFQGELIFVGTCSTCSNNATLWKFDGSSFIQVSNAVFWANLPTNSGINIPAYRKKTTIFQNKLYFPGYDSVHGYELWEYDGNVANMAVEILPGSNGGFGESTSSNSGSFATSFTVYQNKLCFTATDGVHAIELWKFDGVNANMIQDVNIYNPSVQAFTIYPMYLEVFDDKLYFMHSNNSDGTVLDSIGLFMYDGNSIQEVADIFPNHTIGINPQGLKTAGPYLYFNATDSIHGRELWRLESCNIQNSSTQSALVCQQYVSISGDTLYSSGIYKDTLTNICGGDSVVKTYLTVNTVDASVTQNGFSLQANSNGVTYQWIDCDDAGAIIPGETSHLFEPATNGNYALIVTNVENGCTDTSACHTIAGLTVNTSEEVVFSIYPNPSQGQFNIQYAGSLDEIKVSAYTLLGQEIPLVQSVSGGVLHFTMSPASGFVLIKIATTTGVYAEKLRVE
ncbi:hypothetical protein DNU06_02080 [Putridiphycobacter roseus]|uniref:Secretion system C-terminal sorting domain-containing protein n=1 Tax=Putridiphycobacter roseus TaxID=2219161 RepID=A0A2W1N671_9FLAO|nr:hypothetical protein [Putridiphycobacter roseus]PZE18641.1 hypothetical protein DNU06_02080 [Putridiphycobacter roseus]